MSATTVHDLKADTDLIGCQWFDTQEEVFACLREMRLSGWVVTREGLESIDDVGRKCVARPVKIKGNDWFSGVAVWRVSNFNET